MINMIPLEKQWERWTLHKQFSENSPKNIRLGQCGKKLIHCSARSFFFLWQKNKNSYKAVLSSKTFTSDDSANFIAC